MACAAVGPKGRECGESTARTAGATGSKRSLAEKETNAILPSLAAKLTEHGV